MQNIWKKTHDFLVSSRGNGLLVFLFFLLLATVFWILQTLDETLEKEVSVKLELVDVPEDVVIITPMPGELKAIVSDKGTSLIHYVRHGAEPLRISFADYYSGADNGRVMIQNSDVQKKVQSCLLSTSRIKSCVPDTLEFYYNHGLSKTVPVVVAGTMTVTPEYYLLDVKATPSEVTVYAAPAILDTLTAVWTKPVNIENIAANTTVQAKLQDIYGAKYSEESVQLDVLVDVYMEKSVNVPVHTSNFPANKMLRTFPDVVQVVYTVGYAMSNKIKDDDFIILLTYEQILEYQKEGMAKIPLTLRNVPEDVISARVDPAEVDYLIETRDVAE